MLNAVLVLLAVVCAALPLAEHAGALAIAAPLGVAALGACAAWRARRRVAAAPSAPAEAAAGSNRLAELPRLLSNVLPVWLKHFGAVKGQTEEAINQLARSLAAISRQFEAAGFKGATTGAGGEPTTTFSLLTLCERQLQPMVSSMTTLRDSKGALVQRVHDLSRATVDLQDMAEGVSHIAAQTNLLAINAAIEAARVGEAGRGFTVIAKEIRNLSQMSAETGRKMSTHMAQIGQIIKATVEATTRAAADDKLAVELTASVIEDVLTHVRELSVESEGMRGQGNVIRTEIENLVMGLQFQDRVSQIIGVIDGDIQRLHRVIEGGDEVIDPQRWLADLQHHYTMHDQRRSHTSRDAAATPAAAAAAAAEAVTFF